MIPSCLKIGNEEREGPWARSSRLSIGAIFDGLNTSATTNMVRVVLLLSTTSIATRKPLFALCNAVAAGSNNCEVINCISISDEDSVLCEFRIQLGSQQVGKQMLIIKYNAIRKVLKPTKWHLGIGCIISSHDALKTWNWVQVKNKSRPRQRNVRVRSEQLRRSTSQCRCPQFTHRHTRVSRRSCALTALPVACLVAKSALML